MLNTKSPCTVVKFKLFPYPGAVFASLQLTTVLSGKTNLPSLSSHMAPPPHGLSLHHLQFVTSPPGSSIVPQTTWVFNQRPFLSLFLDVPYDINTPLPNRTESHLQGYLFRGRHLLPPTRTYKHPSLLIQVSLAETPLTIFTMHLYELANPSQNFFI